MPLISNIIVKVLPLHVWLMRRRYVVAREDQQHQIVKSPPGLLGKAEIPDKAIIWNVNVFWTPMGKKLPSFIQHSRLLRTNSRRIFWAQPFSHNWSRGMRRMAGMCYENRIGGLQNIRKLPVTQFEFLTAILHYGNKVHAFLQIHRGSCVNRVDD